MNTITTQLLIFKTDISTLCTNCEVHKVLDKHPEVSEWSLDAEDEDHVLRIASETLTAERAVSLIRSLGHECSEL